MPGDISQFLTEARHENELKSNIMNVDKPVVDGDTSAGSQINKSVPNMGSEEEILNANDSASTTSDSDVDNGEFIEYVSSSKRKNLKRKERKSVKNPIGEGGSPQGASGDRENRFTNLYFHRDCSLSYEERIKWVISVAKSLPQYMIRYREGRNRAFILVKEIEAVTLLTTGEGYNGVKLEHPSGEDKLTKIIIKRYPLCVDLDWVKEREQVLWARRNTIKGKESEQVIALWKGDIPGDRVGFVPGLPPNPIAVYNDPPTFCLKCSGWGHKAWNCHAKVKCRFCGKSHESKICGKQIAEGQKITPQCANCGGGHNASSIACPKHPNHNKEIKKPSETPIRERGTAAVDVIVIDPPNQGKTLRPWNAVVATNGHADSGRAVDAASGHDVDAVSDHAVDTPNEHAVVALHNMQQEMKTLKETILRLEKEQKENVCKMVVEQQKNDERIAQLISVVEKLHNNRKECKCNVSCTIDERLENIDVSPFQDENTKKKLMEGTMVPKNLTNKNVKKTMNKMPEGEQAKLLWAVQQLHQHRDYIIDTCKSFDNEFPE